ncbi:sigma-54-dependent Fis family transcriptional regulator [Acidithiobacillus sp. CV18-2]|uniref:Sigma-54-dependent Fis family transcriptional regulator n=1 Tax=Igneacidithiobacillus copahuensis TaxID=2724909 RepID=A0AAE2YRL0_9PROT|nr:sigma-54-dependent Fis family transcriptional regulator [Igneacidithiobacillus copahuensis]MBU2753358.1 sigma-54-dependent Fis family transcriptional regulator [Acidithiobacillus sp. CV18-3]MBU2756388.1 sigma-54-dependent Fis family transcriptional regulator [Acidithiobacillus sp. BN09-2]MBU2776175.1 sigma-54-dependent Fis family transcriptional regulator [Acidithiobacillus sp. CV18-2]MBU2795788.1 sigma-54-dependent Fis family transcriptional regulator [Acidithiobacillus sp. VAN18-2]MBU2798
MLKQLRPELTSLLDCFALPAVLLEADHTVLAANQAYRKQFGDGKPLQGRHCDEILRTAGMLCDDAGNECPMARCQQSNEAAHALRMHDGRALQVDLFPIRNADGKPAYFLELLTPLTEQSTSTDGLVGQGARMQELSRALHRAAPSDVPVLLLGESGTGKELAAGMVHRASQRAQGAFVVLDCSGLSETLFESELFGHEKGAFTGAHSRKIGLAEAANGGTLFLDEVGDIPLPLQVKLLRLLESGTFRRVGGIEPIRSRFRLISATHRDLERMVREGTFRQDLYYRISTFPITLPPLRERREDIPQLTESLLHNLGYPRLRLSTASLELLLAYDFPGNVRELRNILNRAALLTDDVAILPEHLPTALQQEPATTNASPATDFSAVVPLEELEARYLRWARLHHAGDRRSLAHSLGLSERTLYRKLEAIGDPSQKRESDHGG